MPHKHKIKLDLQDIMGDGCHPFVNALVNGVEARLLIDTGASKTVLDKSFLLTLEPKVELEQSEQLSTGLGAGNLPSEFVRSLKLELGSFGTDDISVAVLDLFHVNETYRSIGLPVLHGVIGGDLLLEHDAVIDYKKKTLKLFVKKKRKRSKVYPSTPVTVIPETSLSDLATPSEEELE